MRGFAVAPSANLTAYWSPARRPRRPAVPSPSAASPGLFQRASREPSASMTVSVPSLSRTKARVGSAALPTGLARPPRRCCPVSRPRMPPANRDDGLRAAVTLREAYAGLPVVVLSQYVERSYVVRLLDSYQGAAAA